MLASMKIGASIRLPPKESYLTDLSFCFAQIRDNYPKCLLTRNDPIQQRDDIIHANIPEFMQDGGAL
jgi:hypothetical protein